LGFESLPRSLGAAGTVRLRPPVNDGNRLLRCAAGGSARKRADALRCIADLRPTDRVLDVGCADGRIALEVADWVEHVHGIDVSADRVATASRLAAKRGIQNATFETIPVQEYPFEPQSWDVTLFMRVWGKGGRPKPVDADDFARSLRATRRQLVAQAGVMRVERRLREILDICDQEGFDVAPFVAPQLVVANRRGSDARIRELPAFIIVPTSSLIDHPVINSRAA
jgi:SAM-dependent methyltransferase